LSVVEHDCNPSIQEAEARSFEFEASLGNIARICFNQKKKRTKEKGITRDPHPLEAT
jgi:hypothetical protein